VILHKRKERMIKDDKERRKKWKEEFENGSQYKGTGWTGEGTVG
jgi:hypothetical protein